MRWPRKRRQRTLADDGWVHIEPAVVVHQCPTPIFVDPRIGKGSIWRCPECGRENVLEEAVPDGMAIWRLSA